MFRDLALDYPAWFLIFCVLTGMVWSMILYYREKRFSEKSKALLYGLAALRWLSVSLITFLLLNPLLTSLKEELKEPVIVFLDDKSASLPAGMQADRLNDFLNQYATQKDVIGEKYETISLGFGTTTGTENLDSFNQKGSNLSEALNYVYDNLSDQNIGAIVLASDGIYNEGLNPLYSNAVFNAPVFTIGLGDTTLRRDISVKNVLANKIAYLGDKLNIQIDIAAFNASGSSSKLSVDKISGGQKINIGSDNLVVDGGSFFATKSFDILADAPGINRYRIALSGIGNELSMTNNYRDIYIEVIDSREKIHILANSPHPDIYALEDLITNNKNYEVTVDILGQDNVDISEADVLIYHNLPSRENDIAAIETVANRKALPRLFIAGTQIDPAKFSVSQDIISLASNGSVNEMIDAGFVPGFDKFTLSDQLKARLSTYPPLTSLFGNYSKGDIAQVLFNQKIKKVPTQNPMFAFSEKGGQRSAVLVGEGIWKWRMQDLVDYDNADLSGELIHKSLQYLSVKADKRKFRTNVSKNIYKENEAVYFDAQLYNDAYELVNEADVQLALTNEEGRSYDYTFSKTANYYTLNAGILPAGDYAFTGKTQFGGNNYESKGRFSIESTPTEFVNLTADFNLLRALSEKYSGEFMPYTSVNQLSEQINAQTGGLKPTIFASTSTKPLLNNKWLFALIFILISLEWFLRRLSGNY